MDFSRERPMRLKDIPPDQLLRLEAAWLDPGITVLSVVERFRVSAEALRRRFGHKPQLGPEHAKHGGKPHELTGNGWAR